VEGSLSSGNLGIEVRIRIASRRSVKSIIVELLAKEEKALKDLRY
jgi:hypothetical protein